MSARLHLLPLPVAAAFACLAFAGSASAASDSFSGTVANGGCSAARAVSVGGASRIDVTVSSTAQNNTNVLAEIVAADGHVVAGGSYASYDAPSAGSYQLRVCSNPDEASPPQIQYSGLVATGPAGQPVLTGPRQPQPATGGSGVLGARTSLGQRVSGKAAIMTRAGLAWFTVRTVNASTTLRIVDPVHHMTRVVKGLTASYSGSTVRITGHGLRLVLHTG